MTLGALLIGIGLIFGGGVNTMMNTDLIKKLEALTGSDNSIDVKVAVALFKPDNRWVSIRANAAETKIICTDHNAEEETFWADDYTKTPENRSRVIAILKAKEASHDV